MDVRLTILVRDDRFVFPVQDRARGVDRRIRLEREGTLEERGLKLLRGFELVQMPAIRRVATPDPRAAAGGIDQDAVCPLATLGQGGIGAEENGLDVVEACALCPLAELLEGACAYVTGDDVSIPMGRREGLAAGASAEVHQSVSAGQQRRDKLASLVL